MASSPVSRPQRGRLLFVLALGILYLSLFVSVSQNFQALRKDGNHEYPFGIFATSEGGLFVQDFSYNMLFLRGIHDRAVARPYQMEGQAQMARIILPESGSGMHHAYSPVSFILTLLLPYVTNFQAFIVYFIVTGGGILLLTYFYLLPGAIQPLQFGILAVALPSVTTFEALVVGQTAMLTTVLIGALWILLQRRQQSIGVPLVLDLAMALLFWTVCFKPSIGFVPFILLAASQSWRALSVGLGLLLATWTLLCGYYGGFWTGIADYAYLVDHYGNGLIPRYGEPPPQDAITLAIFALKRDALLVSGIILVLLRWAKRISLSELFQILLWVFVLFSPYLLTSEYWILVLLVVEGSFFISGTTFTCWIKWALMFIIFNVRANIGLTDHLAFPAQLILLAWLIVTIVRSRSVGQGNDQKGSSVLLAASV
jgi:hypothetical protein